MILNATLRLGLAGKDKNKTKQTKKKCVDLRDLEISLYGITAISTLMNTPKEPFWLHKECRWTILVCIYSSYRLSYA